MRVVGVAYHNYNTAYNGRGRWMMRSWELKLPNRTRSQDVDDGQRTHVFMGN